jgi:hypothetical protein
MIHTYYFENGVSAGIGSSVTINYAQSSDPTVYHFDGIDGTSMYNDVITRFGNDPFIIREGSTEEYYGAIVSYGYWIVPESQFVYFFFDTEGNVVTIHFFVPV